MMVNAAYETQHRWLHAKMIHSASLPGEKTLFKQHKQYLLPARTIQGRDGTYIGLQRASHT
jgi:hypothetical protein